MGKTYIKNIFRTIRQTISRFGAIFAIVALGVGFLAGLMATTPDMRYSGDVYFDNSKLFDIRLVGTMGLTEEDLSAVKKIDGVEQIMPAYTADMLVKSPDGNQITTRIHSLPVDKLYDKSSQGYLNRLELVEGRLPTGENECVIEANSAYTSYGFGINDTLEISDDNKNVDDTFKNKKYKIVGIVTSSYYFSLEKEASSVGNGVLSLIMYVAQENFNLDVYTDFYMLIDGSTALNSLTSEYEDVVEKAVDELEKISKERGEIRYQQVKLEGREKLDDAKLEYEDGKKEADEKLADALKKINDGEKEFADGQNKLSDAWLAILAGEANLNDGEHQLKTQQASVNAQFQEAYKKLDEAEKQVNNGLNDVKGKTDAAQAQVSALGVDYSASPAFISLRALALKYPTLAQQLKELQDSGARVQEIQQLIVSGTLTQTEIDKLTQEAVQLGQKIAQIQASEGYIAYTQAMGALAMELSIADPNDIKLVNLGQLGITLGSLDSAKLQLEQSKQTISDNRKNTDEMRIKADAQISAGYASLAAGREKLEKGTEEYRKGEKELADAKKKLDDGKKEYEAEKKKAEKKLADAKKEIEDAEKTLSEMETPEWYLLTRDENMSAASFKSNIQKVEAIAKVFPIFFFLVAALVALTTMTRMVEDERLQIGTLKALGYSKGVIMSKYIFYALTASLLGSVVGLSIGFKLFPTVIWNAYTMMYTLPKLYSPWNWYYAILASGAAILCTLLATMNACWSTLKEKPASLMLPKAPKAGKRILLERVTFIWKKMKFTHKVTARNLFRYKKRLLMTVVGIAGCTALLVTGFGLHDSISDIVNKQFGEIFTYEAGVSLKNNEAMDNEDIKKVINDKSLVTDYLAVHQEKCSNKFGNETFNTYIFVPEQFDKLPNFVSMHDRKTGDMIHWDENSVVITEKMSTRTGLKAGDKMMLTNKDNMQGEFIVTGVCENYVENYVYMSKQTYEKGFNEKLDPSMLVFKVADNSQQGRDKLATAILENDDVAGINFISTLKEQFSNMMSKIDIIVVVLILSAGALAFIVLYNLTNINITERIKEIATIKVLGFTDKEVNAYVYRESIVLSIIGTAVGLGLGVLLHAFVISKAEVDMVMFGHTIKTMSYIYSAALTMVFSLFVNFVMKGKLKRISMVESMKAPE